MAIVDFKPPARVRINWPDTRLHQTRLQHPYKTFGRPIADALDDGARSSSPLRSLSGENYDGSVCVLLRLYGLVLGLAVTELLQGFAAAVRMRVLRRLEPQTALLALFTFVAICATWIDAWNSLRSVPLNFSGLWAPVLLATAYYLAAAVIFPRDVAEYEYLADYYADRKRFVISMLFVAELLVNYTFWDVLTESLNRTPAVFWLYFLPYNVAIKCAFVALFIVKGRRANIALLSTLIFLLLVPYWGTGMIASWISGVFDYGS